MAGELYDWMLTCESREVYTAPPELTNALQNMLSELMSQRLEVGLAPSKDPEIARRGGKVRQVVGQNPDWYRRFAGQFTANRTVPRAKQSHDTLIKRRDTIRTLQGLLAGGTLSVYAPKLIEAARAYQAASDAEDAHWKQKAETMVPPVVRQATPDEIDDITPF